MSKKNKKKNKKKNSYYDYAFGKKAKKNGGKKGGKKSAYKDPELKSVKPSLDKKDAKESKKILLEPVNVPKEFMKNRNRCNHAADIISVSEFKGMTPTYAAFTPMVDPMVEAFGEDNVAVCKSCYDVLVDCSKISTADLQRAVAMLYAAANAVVSHKRLKADEIKEIAKVKEALGDWNPIIAMYEKLEDKGSFDNSDGPIATSASKELSDAEIAKMSRTGGGSAPFSVQ